MISIAETRLPGVVMITPRVFGDSRGHFKETYQARDYSEFGIDATFVQDNFSRSSCGVLRGLHFQVTQPQGKLVSCLSGRVFDVAVDINPESSTFRQWVGVELSDENHQQLYIPPGYAHGFCVISDTADFHYKCTAYYDPSDEAGIRWDDPAIDIDWPLASPMLSEKDGNLPNLDVYLESLA